MRLKVQYGSEVHDVEIPDTCTVEVLEGKEAKDADEARIIREAVERPLNAPPIKEFLEGGKVLIFTNDGDRPTPTWRMFETFIDLIKDRPDTKIVVGCGTHKAPTDEDYRFIFGPYYDDLKHMITYHNAKDEENLVSIGTTSRGNEVFVNKLVEWADKLLITGSVEPHYFAGFTGGRKWVIGVGGFKTIERNHIMALKDSAATLALDGNPIHEELIEWDRMIDRPKFGINLVQDKHLKAAACFAGDMDRVFEECVRVGHNMYSADTEGDADIVVTVARAPQDNNLYQALKAQEHGKLAMRDGGILILVAQCARGLGPSHFGAMLRGKTAQDVLNDIETEFHLGHHKIGKLLNTLMKGKVWAVTDLDADDVASVQMRKFDTVQEAMDAALKLMGDRAKIIVLPDGGMTVPRIMKRPPQQRLALMIPRGIRDIQTVAKKRAEKVKERVKERVKGTMKRAEKVRGVVKERASKARKRVTAVRKRAAKRGTKARKRVRATAKKAVKRGRKAIKKAAKRRAPKKKARKKPARKKATKRKRPARKRVAAVRKRAAKRGAKAKKRVRATAKKAVKRGRKAIKKAAKRRAPKKKARKRGRGAVKKRASKARKRVTAVRKRAAKRGAKAKKRVRATAKKAVKRGRKAIKKAAKKRTPKKKARKKPARKKATKRKRPAKKKARKKPARKKATKRKRPAKKR